MLGEKDLLFNISNIISVTLGMLVHIACAHHCTAQATYFIVSIHLLYWVCTLSWNLSQLKVIELIIWLFFITDSLQVSILCNVTFFEPSVKS